MNRSIFSVSLALVLSLVSACGPGNYKQVSVQELANASKDKPLLILDVREDWEFAQGHVPGAVLIPLGDLEYRAGELAKDSKLYVICRSGNRSQQASEILIKKGFKDVHNVQGGMLAWLAAGYPVQ